jgi:DNA-binding NtrC family response regulator
MPIINHESLFQQHMMNAERELILATLEQHGGKRLDAALALGLHPMTFERKVRKHGLNLKPRDGL